MLTSVARAALRRVLTRTPATTTSTATRVLPIRSAIQTRSFTSSEPALEPAAAVKKAPKSAGAKKSTVTKKAKDAPKKKVAAKKKPAAKKKVVAKKKKPAAAKKPAKKLTPEEKDATRRRQLKQLALLNKAPKPAPVSPWLLYITRNQKDKPSPEASKAMATGYANLSASEMAVSTTFSHHGIRLPSAQNDKDRMLICPQEYRDTVEANRTANHAQHVAWVETYPKEVIVLANLSRRELSRKTGKKILPIVDARLPAKYIRSGYNFYIADSLTGGVRDPKRFAEIASAWKTMSPEEKRPFNEMAEAEKTLVTRQREELAAKVRELRQTNKEEAKRAASVSKPRKLKTAATNDVGL